jgi:RNA polymerase sigma-70 factor (ECF subfamily)
MERRRLDNATDRELMLKAAAGERQAFALLLERHYDRIHRLAWRLVGNAGDAEDVAQDVCVKLATAIRSFRGDAEPGTWIWRITYNAAMDLVRSRQRVRPLGPSEMMGLVEASDDQAMSATGSGESGELWSAVRRLPGQQRDAVTLVYGEDLSHAEAAAVMGCTEKTVSWHLHEARKRLRALLAPAAGERAKAPQNAPAAGRTPETNRETAG